MGAYLALEIQLQTRSCPEDFQLFPQSSLEGSGDEIALRLTVGEQEADFGDGFIGSPLYRLKFLLERLQMFREFAPADLSPEPDARE